MTAALHLEVFTARDVPQSVLDCELDVLHHWYGDTPELLDVSYTPFLARTAFVALRDRRPAADGGDRTVGFARLIANSPAGTRTLADIAAPPWSVDPARSLAAAGIDPATTWDLATLGVRPDAGHAGTAAAALYHGILHTVTANGARTLVAVIDPRVRRIFAAVGFACHTLPGTGPADYMGSTGAVPIWTDLAAMVDEQRRSAPDAYRLITLGTGLGEVALPRREDLVVRWEDDREDAVDVTAPRPVVEPVVLPDAQPERAGSR